MGHSDLIFDFNHMMAEVCASGVELKEIDALGSQIKQIHSGLQDLRRLGQMPYRDLPYHDEGTKKILEKSGAVGDRFDFVLILGIGGSALGARFLIDALGSNKGPQIFQCESVDPAAWIRLSDRIDFSRCLLIAVSKSGNTLETMASFLYFTDLIRKKSGSRWKEGLWIVTDPQEGALRRFAREEGIATFDIPPGVGGRFSVLSAAGLVPAACAGVDIVELLAGARRMDERCQKEDPWFNPALMSASLHFLLDRNHERKIRVLMNYGQRLREYPRWFCQLWSESLGKRFSLRGEEVFSGTTPVPAMGPEDQHSQLQLYLEGPRDKSVTFIAFETDPTDAVIPSGTEGLSAGGLLQGLSAHRLLAAERMATETALLSAGCPNQTILIKEVNPYLVGQLLTMAEVETVFAGALYNVNPFDQPGVEAIKRNTRDFLAGKVFAKKNRSYRI